MIYFVIDGQQIPNSEHDYVDNADITYTLAEDGKRKRKETKFAKQVRFTGSAYNYIKTKLIDPILVNNVILICEIYDTCCQIQNGTDKLLFKGKITKDSIDFCEFDCYVTCDIKEFTETEKQYICAESTYIWANGEGSSVTDSNFAAIQHPFVRHCIEFRPGFLQVLQYFFGFIIFLVIIVLLPVIGILITAINAVIALVGGNPIGNGNINFFDDLGDLAADVAKGIIQCGRGNPSPFITSYLDHVCKVCGLTWQSDTIINLEPSANYTPYKNLVLFHAPVKKGKFDYFTWQEENKPLMTLASLSDFICETFNGNWEIENGILRIERKDVFETFFNSFDISEIDSKDIISLCYSYSGDKLPAFLEISYTLDGIDWVGNEAFRDLYTDIVEFKSPSSDYPDFEGRLTVNLPIGPVRFRNDNVEDDILSVFEPFFSILTSIINWNYDPAQFTRAVLMPQHTFTTYKMFPITVPDDDPIVNPRVEIGTGGNTNYKGFAEYNAEMWISAVDNSQKPWTDSNLYQRFWSIEDSRTKVFKGLKFELKLRKTCDYVNTINLKTKIITPQGVGRIDEISIGISEIVINGTI